MKDITVTVSGPGGTFTYEFEIIRRALASVGCCIEVTDSHPTDPDHLAAYMEKMETKLANTSVSLVAKHCPWGG